uniref:Centrosomin N-terminal motif 1 domain-containing protein n=1 Tax=Graphocephala atropunctata TaxID=36148 RepID=A0A1B6MP47_9HEMI
MSDPNKAGFSGSPPVRLARLVIPPRTLPSQLDESTFTFDGREPGLSLNYKIGQIPFSPTSPGKRSPGRPKTMKEYEEDLVNLKRENFNLKVKIYFMEQNRVDPNLPKNVDELRTMYSDLKAEHELTEKDLSSKEDLLISTYRALDAQKQQLEAMNSDFETMKTEHEQEKLELQSRIEDLEKELKDTYAKFMETSINLDDTNAMYALTFGLDRKSETKLPNPSEIKIKELESNLAKERKRVSSLEDKITGLQSKLTRDQGSLEEVHKQAHSLAEELKEAEKMKSAYQKMVKDAHENIRTKKESYEAMITMKEMELENKSRILKNVQRNLDLATSALQDKQGVAQTQLEINLQSVTRENLILKQEVRKLQKLLEERGTPRSSRERSVGRSSSEWDQEKVRQLRQALEKVEELTKERKVLKEQVAKYSKCYRSQDSEHFIQTLMKQNKVLEKEVEELRATSRKRIDLVKEEVIHLK